MSEPAEVTDAELVESTEVERYQAAAPALFRTDDPVEVIEKATKVADALKAVVKSRGLITSIQGREHPRVEAWQTLGSMLGVFPVKEWVRPVPWPEPTPEGLKPFRDRGLAFGFEASFVAQRPDGSIVGGGEAACMRTESTWKGRDDFALKSMAQTRATSKALKAPLGFVMTLAGYEATPAEEMPAEEQQQAGRPLGPEYDKKTIGKVVAGACVQLAGDKDRGITLFRLVAKDCGGYLPQAAALALIRAAETDNLVPTVDSPDPS